MRFSVIMIKFVSKVVLDCTVKVGSGEQTKRSRFEGRRTGQRSKLHIVGSHGIMTGSIQLYRYVGG